MKRLVGTLAFCSLIVALAYGARGGELPQASPESQGIAPAKLAVAEKAVKDLVDKKEYAGAITLVARKRQDGVMPGRRDGGHCPE